MPVRPGSHRPQPDIYGAGERFKSGPEATICAHGKCKGPVPEESPVALCGKHLIEAHLYVEDRKRLHLDAQEAELAVAAGVRRFPKSAARAQVGQSYVYFLRLGDRIKIGYTTNLKERLKNLPHEEVLCVIPGTMDDERRYLEQWSCERTAGEWFRASTGLLEFVAQMQEHPDRVA